MILTLFRQPFDQHYMTVAGESGREYQFTWNKKSGRYESKDLDQQSVDDLCATAGPYSLVYFSPLCEKGEPAKIHAAPTIERKDYDDMARPDLLALAKNCGVTVRAGDDDNTVKRLIDAYFLGCGFKKAVESTPSPVPPKLEPPALDLDPTPTPAAPVAQGRPKPRQRETVSA